MSIAESKKLVRRYQEIYNSNNLDALDMEKLWNTGAKRME